MRSPCNVHYPGGLCVPQLELSVSERLSPLVPHENADLLNVTIRLLLNLSFDAKHRAQMVNVGLLPKLVNLICEAGRGRGLVCWAWGRVVGPSS